MTEQTQQTRVDAPGQDLFVGSVSRRRFLMGSGAVTVAAVAAACGDGGDDEDEVTSAPTTSVKEDPDADAIQIARTAAGLEVLAVNTYREVGEVAAAGKIGTVPPAVGEYVKTAMAHHQEHLDAWNEVLTKANENEVTQPEASLQTTVEAELTKVTDVAAAANLALMLERIAADTYLKAVPKLKDKSAIELAASIQAVDRQHQAILLFALGMYPVPDTFQTTAKAAF